MSIHRVARIVDEIRTEAGHRPGDGATDEMLTGMSTALNEAGAASALGATWAEFRASLVRRNGSLYRLREAHESFREEMVEASITADLRRLHISVPYSFTIELPGFMVGLGMLGTFIGISIGLGVLGPAATGSANILDKIGDVISGLASAFWTSIFGLIASSITAWRNHKAESALDFALDRFCRALDASIGLASSELLLEEQSRESERHGKELVRMREAQEQANTYLSTLANDLSESLGPLLEKVATAVRDQVTSVAQPVVEMFEGLTESMVGSLDDAVGRMGEQLQTFNGQFESLGTTLGQHLTGAATAFETGVARAGKQLNVSLDAAVGRASRGLGEMGDRTMEAMTNVGKRMELVVTSMGDQVNESVFRMSRGVEETSTQMTTRFSEMGGRLQAGLADATTAMVEDLKRATEQAGKRLVDLLGPFTTALEVLQAITKALHSQAQAQSALLDRQTTVTREVNDVLNAAAIPLRSLASHTNTINTAIQALERATARVTALEGALAEIGAGVSGGLTQPTRSGSMKRRVVA